MKQPLVSIVTPSYNSKEFFIDTFNSVILQTYKNWEWIIIDDCSTDGSFEYVADIIKGNNKITLVRNERNCGAAKTRNLGIKLAKGSYVAFLDADDIWAYDKIEKQLLFMMEHNSNFCYGWYYVLSKNNIKKLFCPKTKCTDYNKLLKKCDIGCFTVMINIEKIGKVFMPVDTPKREDYATWLKLTRAGIVANNCCLILGTYRLSSTSVTANKIGLVKYHWNVYRNFLKMSIFKSTYYLFIHSLNKLFFKY